MEPVRRTTYSGDQGSRASLADTRPILRRSGLKFRHRYAVVSLVLLVTVLAKARCDKLVHGLNIRLATATLIVKHHANTGYYRRVKPLL